MSSDCGSSRPRWNRRFYPFEGFMRASANGQSDQKSGHQIFMDAQMAGVSDNDVNLG